MFNVAHAYMGRYLLDWGWWLEELLVASRLSSSSSTGGQ